MRSFSTAFTILVFLAFMTAGLLAADRFDRSATIQADTLDIGGFGNVVGGVDLDNDGKIEIYAVNDDWHDKTGYDLVPRIYKYEKNDMGQWEVVWSTRLPLDFQNTWPALTIGDLDKDGKGEVIWGPVNNFAKGLQPNPMRIAVFETPGDGTDNMGVQNPDGTWRPNAQWTIVSTDNVEQRPIKWIVSDIDKDGVDELVAGSRRGDGIQVYSVDNIPDAADSTETWTLEFSGVPKTFYDMTVLDSLIVGIQSNGDVWLVKYDAVGDSFVVMGPQVGLAGRGSWKSATAVDVNNDGEKEILLASWSSLDNDVYLLQRSADSLIATKIVDVPSSSYRSYGGDAGDIDGDGLLDFVFGTRSSTPNGVIHRVEFQGGAIDDPANWTISVIDHGVSKAAQYDIIDVAQMDDDPEDEVLYSGIPRGLSASDPPQPIVVLDLIPSNQAIITGIEDVPNDQGRQVWVVWRGAEDDAPVVTNVDGAPNSIPVAIIGDPSIPFPDMEIDGKKVVPVYTDKTGEPNTEAVGDITNYVVWRIDNGNPVQVATTVPVQATYYAAVVPTLGDGSEWAAKFKVSSHTADPSTFWMSFPKMGYSEDNLIPTAPSVSAVQVDSKVELMWEELPDPDINYFSVRRSTEAGFDPTDPSTEVGTTTETIFIDENVEGGKTYYYHVVAYDFNGNQGEFSPEVSTSVTGIEDEELRLPKSFALHQNYPNPFNPETNIAFDIPTRTNVTIVIYNTLGQKVRTLIQDVREPGSYKVVWDGRNDAGIQVASGVYIYMIRAGNFVKSKKMTLMR